MLRHVAHGRVGGEAFRAPVSISFEVSGGRITRIHEYVDSAAIQALIPRRATAA
jgi:ketosteroid isomerase-like protein